MKYTYANWLSAHAAEKKVEKIETVTTGQFSVVEEKTAEPETVTTFAPVAEETVEEVVEITEEATEDAPADEAETEENAEEEEAQSYKYRGGYRGKH